MAVSILYSRAVWLPQLPILCMELGVRRHAGGLPTTSTLRKGQRSFTTWGPTSLPSQAWAGEKGSSSKIGSCSDVVTE